MTDYVITDATEVQALLGTQEDISDTILMMADRWVIARMKGKGLVIPAVVTDEMKMIGAFIACSFFINSKGADMSWFQSVNLAGASFTRGNTTEVWEQRAIDELNILAETGAYSFEVVTYWND